MLQEAPPPPPPCPLLLRRRFEAWDEDDSGTLQYTEILHALSGQRYDALADTTRSSVHPDPALTPP
jgi:hypothetical protein